MWKALLLCLLVAYGAAEQQQQQQQQQNNGAWRPNTEYKYSVHTHTLTAIPNLKNQWVGVYTKADLTIRQLAKDKLIGKLNNGQYSEFHDALANGPAQYKPENELEYKPMEMNAKPFEIRMNNGIVHSIAVDKEMTNIELNRVKSILSQLQVDIQARNAIDDERNHLAQNNDAEDNDNQATYKVMEPTVTGKCETNYDISRIPEHLAQNYPEINSNVPVSDGDFVYEVTKSKNYSNCEQSMGYHFGVSGLNEWKPNTNVMGSLSKSAVSRIIITGNFNEYLIRSSVTTNRVVKAVADKENKHDSMVVSQVNVTLRSAHESHGKLNVNTENLVDIGNLVYSYDLPSDSKNELRPKNDSSESEEDEDSVESAENSLMKESPLFQNEMSRQYNRPKQTRSPRSIRNNRQQQNQNQNQNQNEWNNWESNDEEINQAQRKSGYLQPKPTLNNAPESPMHFYSIGNKGHSIQNSAEFNAQNAIQQILSEIVDDLQDPNELPKKQTLRKFNMLAKVIRTMNAQQINEASNRIVKDNEDNQQQANKARKVYTDALVSAGTGPAVSEVMRLIEQQRIRGEAAAELIAQIPRNLRLPSEEMQKRFFEFVKHDAVKNQENVNTTAGIAFTSYLFRAQAYKKVTNNYYPVESYAQLADHDSKFVEQEVVPYYRELLEQAVNNKDAPTILYAVRALGNLANKNTPKVFEQYLNGKTQVTDFQRLTMVLALDKYAAVNPKSAQGILYQLYQNKGETSEIRSVALFQLMRTNPSASYLQRIAEETNTEENRDVRSAARSAIESAARLQNPQQSQLARNAQAALNLLKPEQLGVQYSRTYLHDYVLREMDASYQKQCSYITEKSSFIPSGILTQTFGDVGGFKQRSEYQAIVSSVQQLVDTLYSTFKPARSNQNNQNNADEDITADNLNEDSSPLTADKIIKLLKGKAGQNRPLEGQLLFEAIYGNRFVAFDEHTLKQWAQKLRKEANELQNGRNVNYAKMFNENDLKISFPLESGLPFEYTYRQTTLVQVDGHVRVETEPNVNENNNQYNNNNNNNNNGIRVPEQIKINAELQAVYSTVKQNTMSFINPNNRQRYTGGSDKNYQVYAPLRVSSHINTRTQEVKTEIRPHNENKQYKLLQIGSWPFTTRTNLFDLQPPTLSTHTKNINQRPLRQTNYSFGEKETGLAFAIQGTYENDLNQIMAILNQLRKHDLTSLLMFGHENTSPQHYSLDLVLDAEKSSTKMAQFTLAYKNGQNEQQQQQQQQQQYNANPKFRLQSANGNQNENLAVPENVQPNSQSRREQLMRNAAEGMSAPTKTDVVDIAIEFVGSNKHEYIATIAGATDQSQGKSRILAFLQKSQTSKQSKALYLQVDAKYKNANEQQNQQNQQNNNNNDRPSAELKFKLSYALDNTLEMATLRGNVQLKQSTQLNEQIRTNANKQAGEQRKNTVDHIDIELDTADMPVDFLEQNFSLKVADVYNYIRYATYQYLEQNNEYKGQQNKLAFEVRLLNDLSWANIKMHAANMKSEWKGIPLPKMWKNLIAVPSSQSNYNLLKEVTRNAIQYQDTCQIQSNQINTFGNVTIQNVHYDNTWHVAVQHMHRDQSGKSNQQYQQYQQNQEDANKPNDYLAIAVRNHNNNNQENENQEWSRNNQHGNKNIEVAIVLRQNANSEAVINLRPANQQSNNAPRLSVNGNEKQISESKVHNIYSNENPRELLARVYIVKQNTLDQSKVDMKVETTIGNYQVTYNGKQVQIQRDSMLRSNQGTCGAQTGQWYNELKSPQNKLMNNKKDFVASWALIENGQAQMMSLQAQQKVRNTEYPSEETVYSNPIPNTKRSQKPWSQQQQQERQYENDNAYDNEQNRNSQNRQQNNNQRQNGTKHQTQYIEDQRSGQICFSKRPLPICAPGTKANGKYIQAVEVYCRDINDPAAKQYKSQIHRGRNLNMSAHPTNNELKFNVPKRCERV